MMKFFLGFIVGVCLLLAAEYLFIAGGGVKMGTDATTLPMEDFLAHQAIAASMGKAAKEESTVPADETNLWRAPKFIKRKGVRDAMAESTIQTPVPAKISTRSRHICCHRRKALPTTK